MTDLLGHDFVNAKCLKCGAAERSVREFQTPCGKAHAAGAEGIAPVADPSGEVATRDVSLPGEPTDNTDGPADTHPVGRVAEIARKSSMQ